MKITVYRVDSNGFIVDTHVATLDANQDIIEKDLMSCIKLAPQNGLYKAKYSGGEWIEGATQEEIDTIKNTSPISDLERLRLEMARGNTEIFETMLVMIQGGK